MKMLRIALLGLACAVPTMSMAQWQWIDKDGRKVFSDRPPPLETPQKNILKQPGVKAAPAEAPAAQAAAPAPAVKASAPQASGKDSELEQKKKALDAAEAAKKKAREDELATMRADNCVRAKRAKASLDSGVRISRTNDKGEREILDDAARAAESKHIQAVIASDCKTD